MIAQKNNIRHSCAQQGFTLMEVLIALAVGGVIMAAVMTTFRVQQRSYLAQDEVVVMQQNARLAMDMLARDIRMAGYNPTGTDGPFTFVDNVQFSNAGATILTTVNTNATAFAFRSDLNGSGTVDLTVTDVNGDGIIDLADMEQIAYRFVPADRALRRYSTITGFIAWLTVADQIEELEFLYLLNDGTTVLTPTPAELPLIRAVRISLLARAAVEDRQYTDAVTYTTASGALWGPYNDNIRRRLLIQTVICRNLGL